MSDSTPTEQSRAADALSTPGPWTWRTFGNIPHLCTTHGGALIVLQPVRKGMQGASFRLRDAKCIMQDFDPLHPDAQLIARAPELLAEVADLQSKISQLEQELLNYRPQ